MWGKLIASNWLLRLYNYNNDEVNDIDIWYLYPSDNKICSTAPLGSKGVYWGAKLCLLFNYSYFLSHQVYGFVHRSFSTVIDHHAIQIGFCMLH